MSNQRTIQITLILLSIFTICDSQLPQITNKYLDLYSKSHVLFEENNFSNLEAALSDLTIYFIRKGKYPKDLEGENIINLFLLGNNNAHDSPHVARVFEILEQEVMSAARYHLKYDDYFASSKFLSGQPESLSTVEANVRRLNNIIIWANRVYEVGYEREFINRLLTHPPRKFILDLIIKYSTNDNIPFQSKEFVKYCVKPSWFESLYSNKMIPEEHLDIFLQKMLESDIVDEYIIISINNFLKISNSSDNRKMMSFKLVYDYIFSGKPGKRNSILTQIEKLKYKFTHNDIKKISLDVYDAGTKVSSSWSYFRNNQQDFVDYYEICDAI
ncbi:MAG: hypothetical protein Harvfovirus29_6 [Harvfovirus sp.]|uniref:Uncharacterized protein n=1 Tax=Harvfovirus sp. TaxID=2487768 RepID=A0A3G5A2A1_9VIRU|nr:MAG: hypothetical protein Harvfovirus29_6 [Harvfovirus sp.]